jgi:hypothetical protein
MPAISSQPAPLHQNIGAWREGYRLIVRHDAILPSACVKCGAPAVGPNLRKTFYWQPSGFFRYLPFPGSLIAMIVALVVHRKITVDIPICAVHRRRRRRALILTSIFCGAGLAAIGAGLNWAMGADFTRADNAPWIMFTGIVLLLTGSLCFVCAGRLLSPKQIDTESASFAGAGARFLQLLPQSPNLSS